MAQPIRATLVPTVSVSFCFSIVFLPGDSIAECEEGAIIRITCIIRIILFIDSKMQVGNLSVRTVSVSFCFSIVFLPGDSIAECEEGAIIRIICIIRIILFIGFRNKLGMTNFCC